MSRRHVQVLVSVCDSLELKRYARCSVSHVHVLVERPGCGQCGFGVMPKADDGRRSHRKARRCATGRRRSTASKYKEYGADRVQGSGQAMAVAQHDMARRCAACFQTGHT